jgi:hypothetical protein
MTDTMHPVDARLGHTPQSPGCVGYKRAEAVVDRSDQFSRISRRKLKNARPGGTPLGQARLGLL